MKPNNKIEVTYQLAIHSLYSPFFIDKACCRKTIIIYKIPNKLYYYEYFFFILERS